MRDAYSPLDYSAAADGSTDDTDAIQDCIDAASVVGCDVYLGSETYLVAGTLSIPTGLSIYGDGIESTMLIHDPASAGTDLFMADEVTDFGFYGFTCQSIDANSRHAFNLYRSTRARLDRIAISGSGVTRPWATGLYIERGLQCRFTDCQVEDAAEAALYFNYATGQGQSTTQTFENCRFRTSGRGIDSEGMAVITARFIGCTVETNYDDGVRLGADCQMTFFDPHIENQPGAPAAYPIFDLGSGSRLVVSGGYVGGYSGTPHASSAIIDADGAGLISFVGTKFRKAASVLASGLTADQGVFHGCTSDCDAQGSTAGISAVSDLACAW